MIRLKMHWQLMNGPDGRKHLNLHWETVQTRLSGFASTQINPGARKKAS